MLDGVVAVILVLLGGAGLLVLLGPRNVARRIASLRRPNKIAALFEPRRPREVVPPALNPKTQRVLVAAARLANWLRTHGQAEVAREIRNAAARMTGTEPAGLYAVRTPLRPIRVVKLSDTLAQDRSKALVREL